MIPAKEAHHLFADACAASAERLFSLRQIACNGVAVDTWPEEEPKCGLGRLSGPPMPDRQKTVHSLGLLLETRPFRETKLSLEPVVNPREETAHEGVIVRLGQAVDRRFRESLPARETAVVGLHHLAPGAHIARSGVLPQLLVVAAGPRTAEVFPEPLTNRKEKALKHRVVASVQGSRKPDRGEGDRLRLRIERRRARALRPPESEMDRGRRTIEREPNVHRDEGHHHVKDSRGNICGLR